MISTYAAVGVSGKRAGRTADSMTLPKGFALDHMDGCTLYLKNEGVYKETQESYRNEVTIPLGDLDAATGRVMYYTSTMAEIDKRDGTWRVVFTTKGEKPTARVYTNAGSFGEFFGSNVIFMFQDKKAAMVFEKGVRQVISLCAQQK
jgi:hypothetical protein